MVVEVKKKKNPKGEIRGQGRVEKPKRLVNGQNG
jgi:hypothetical protein